MDIIEPSEIASKQPSKSIGSLSQIFLLWTSLCGFHPSTWTQRVSQKLRQQISQLNSFLTYLLYLHICKTVFLNHSMEEHTDWYEGISAFTHVLENRLQSVHCLHSAGSTAAIRPPRIYAKSEKKHGWSNTSVWLRTKCHTFSKCTYPVFFLK